jgi:uncharacterized membrane protein
VNRYGAVIIGVLLAALLASPVRADLQICNRMSYVVEAALALDDKGATATRGWFRIEPGQCRTVLQGTIEAQHTLVHAEPLPAYTTAPLPQTGHADLCVGSKDFVIAAARLCGRSDQRLVPFTEVKPSESERGATVYLAEEEDYDDAQARLAGIQRLLVQAGYDANPIDGIRGKKTDTALAQFFSDHKLPPETIESGTIFATLLQAAQAPDASAFGWCNETTYPVMAALGVENRGSIVARGWYRIEPGRCLRPPLSGKPRRLYSHAEAIDGSGHVAVRAGKPLSWGGDKMLCTRNVRFELTEHGDCQASGLTAVGFAAIDLTRRDAATVHLKVP